MHNGSSAGVETNYISLFFLQKNVRRGLIIQLEFDDKSTHKTLPST